MSADRGALHPLLQVLLMTYPEALEYDGEMSLTVTDREFFERFPHLPATVESITCRTCHEAEVSARGRQCAACREQAHQEALAARSPQDMTPKMPDTPVRARLRPRPAPSPPPAPPTPLVLAPVPAPREEPPARVEKVIIGGIVDVPAPELPATASELERVLATGIPEALPVEMHPNVLDLYGVDLDLAVSVLRTPQTVVIDGTNKRRDYPVLRFKRGDLFAVVGFKNLRQPALVGVYIMPALEHDHHHVEVHGGGGSKQKTLGKPRTVEALVKRLRLIDVELGAPNQQGMAEATYQGQSLGKVQTLGIASRLDVESSWDRMQRKVHAIERRAQAG